MKVGRTARGLAGDTMDNCKSVKSDELYRALKLGGISVFGALAGVQLEQLWHYLEVRRYGPGQQVFRQSELPSGIYVVLSGKIDFILDNDGLLQIESCYEAGETFGESAYLGIQPHIGSAQVRSTGPAEVLVLTRASLIDMQQQDQDLFALLIMNLAREVSRKYQAKLGA